MIPPCERCHRALFVAAAGLALAGAGPAQALDIVERTLPAEQQGQTEDILILRGGGVQRGSLLGCAGDGCTVAGASVPRDSIAWIGLEAEDASPPGVQDASRDEVHLRDGSVHPGRLVGVSKYDVVTERGGHPRDEVAWIHLAGKEEDPDPPEQPGAVEQPPPPPPPDMVIVDPPGQEEAADPLPSDTPPAVPRPPNERLVEAPPADKPLGGWIDVDWVERPKVGGGHQVCEANLRARLTFSLIPAMPPEAALPWPMILYVGYRVSELHYEIASDGCTDLPGDDEVRTAPGGTESGSFMIDSGRLLTFHPLGPAIDFVSLPGEIERGVVRPYTVIRRDGHGQGSIGFGLTLAIGLRHRGGCQEGSTDGIQSFCVQPTACADSEEAACMVRPDRYAVLPFSGARTWVRPQGSSWKDDVVRSTARWHIGWGCGEIPATSRERSVTLVDLFEPERADVLLSAGPQLDRIAAWMECDLGGAQIVVTVKDDGDELFTGGSRLCPRGRA